MSDPGPPHHPTLRERLATVPPIDERPPDPRILGRRQPAPAPKPAEQPGPVEPESPEPAPGSDEGLDPRRRRRWPFVVTVLLAVVGVLVAVPAFLAWRTFESIERVDVGTALSPSDTGTNVLIVGTDSRSGIDATTENSALILGDGISGERSDTIMVLRLSEDGGAIMSLPRDLWLPIDGGGSQRINTAIARGPDAVIRTVSGSLGIPITNYAQVDLAGFIELVDAVGGVTISIPHPAYDRRSGLDLPEAGEVKLDSTQALAYVRSRRYTERIDGGDVLDPTSDLGRVKRQQEFLRALTSKLAGERNPLTVNEILQAIAGSIAIDDQTSVGDAVDLARRLRSGLPESVTLPTRPASIDGNSVLLMGEGAETTLDRFRG